MGDNLIQFWTYAPELGRRGWFSDWFETREQFEEALRREFVGRPFHRETRRPYGNEAYQLSEVTVLD